jgi:hypothetical protein
MVWATNVAVVSPPSSPTSILPFDLEEVEVEAVVEVLGVFELEPMEGEGVTYGDAAHQSNQTLQVPPQDEPAGGLSNEDQSWYSLGLQPCGCSAQSCDMIAHALEPVCDMCWDVECQHICAHLCPFDETCMWPGVLFP